MGRGKEPLSAVPREMLKKLDSPKIMEFLLKHKMLDMMQQSLQSLVAVADDTEAKLLGMARWPRSASRCLGHCQDMVYRLETVLNKISLGEAADADAKHAVDFILRSFKMITMLKNLLFFTEQRQRSPEKLTVYGRDKEKSEIVDFLRSDQARCSTGNPSVLAITGEHGIGKTTLVDLVYQDDQVKAHFELRGWVEFQEGLDVESLAKMVLYSFDEDFHYDESLTGLMRRLRECLLGKKLLLVLDGFQSLAGWETLRTCFADAAGQGSVVILTTQKFEVALLSDHGLHLGSLSLEDSYYLFSEHAFGDRNLDSYPPELVSVAIQIVRKLGGLPLAAKNLGSLLYNHRHFDMWTKVLKIERSDWLLDLELLLMHCPELRHPPSPERLEILGCDCPVASPSKMPDKHGLMVQEQEQDCTEILATSVAEVTSESSSHNAAMQGEGTIIMPPITNSESDDDDDGEASYMSYLESSFEILKVTDASQLSNLPCGLKCLIIEDCQFLKSLPDKFLSDCSDIIELCFIDCCSLKHFADVLHPNSLRTLYIRNCPNMEFLIPLGTHKKFAFLDYLCIISSCKPLTSFFINLFPGLEVLYIKDCPNLESFSVAEGLHDQNLKLKCLEIWDCPNLISFPKRGLPTPNLRSISISNCRSLKSLPNNLATLTSLQSLCIDKCPELESFPDGGLPSSLSLLRVAFSDKLAPQKQWNLHMLHSLTRFEIESGCLGMKSFPDKKLLPRNLKSLRISRLSGLRVLNGTGLQHLTTLETLEIIGCHGLLSLPEEGLPSSLTCLCIKESSILTQKLLHEAGREWSKVAHIPNLQIDDAAIHGVREGMNWIYSTKHGKSPKMCVLFVVLFLTSSLLHSRKGNPWTETKIPGKEIFNRTN